MLIKIKTISPADKKGNVNVTYKVNGMLRSASVKQCKDIKKAVADLENGKK